MIYFITVFIAIIIIPLISLLFVVKIIDDHQSKKRLKKLVNSERYKLSKYRIQIINGEHALYNTLNGKYVDIVSPSYSWYWREYYSKDCLGSISSVISAFNYRDPIIIDDNPNIEKTY